MKENIRLNIKKNKKHSICTCGFSKKLPFCDNMHRLYNEKNGTNYKSLKIYPSNDCTVELNSSLWDEKEK